MISVEKINLRLLMFRRPFSGKRVAFLISEVHHSNQKKPIFNDIYKVFLHRKI